MVYVGMDVHRKRTQVAILDEEGSELANRNVDNGSVEMRMVLDSLPAGTPVVFEAGLSMGWMIDELEAAGLEAHMAHPTGVKAIAAARLKNDRVDARTLAHLLRTDLLPEAWIAPRPVRDLRGLLRQRAWLVRRRTSAKVRIRGVLADQGVPVTGLWTRPGRARLAAMVLSPINRVIVDQCCSLIDAFTPLISAIEDEIRGRVGSDARLDALLKLPGVGWVTAVTAIAEIGDIKRFPTARQLSSWAGLTPTVRASDRTVRHGHISKRGSSLLRWTLGEAAHTAKRHPDFQEAYQRIARRRGNKIATVAIARQLLVRIFYTLQSID